MPENTGNSIAVSIIELLKAFLWPALALYVIIMLRGPIDQAAQVMPDLLRRTKDIEIAGNKISVSAAAASPGEEVAGALKNMQEASLRYLMERSPEIGFNRCKDFPRNDREIENLLKLKILAEINIPNNDRCPTSTSLTDLGRRTREYLISLVLSQITPSRASP